MSCERCQLLPHSKPILPDQKVRVHFAQSGLDRTAINTIYSHVINPMIASRSYMCIEPIELWLDPQALRRGLILPVDPDSEPFALQVQDSGMVPVSTQIAIVNPETNSLCHVGEYGEIWVQSEASGHSFYMSRDPLDVERFNGRTVDGDPNVTYVRTGDLGFLHNVSRPIGPGGAQVEMQCLFVLGNIGETFDVNGLSHFPVDIENSIERCHRNVVPGGSAVFQAGGLVVVLAEVHRKNFLASIVPVIVNAVLNAHQLVVDIVAFVGRGDFPRSRLGEKQRGKILASWVTRRLRTIAQFGIKDFDAPADMARHSSQSFHNNGGGSVRGSSSLRHIESNTAIASHAADANLSLQQQEYMHPPPEGYAEMPADPYGDDDNSILESPRAPADDFRGSDSTPTGDGPAGGRGGGGGGGGGRPMLELNLPEHSPVELPTHDDYFELGSGSGNTHASSMARGGGRAGPSELPAENESGLGGGRNIPMHLVMDDVPPPSSPSVYSPQVDHRSGILDTPVKYGGGAGGGSGINGSYLDLPSSVDGSGKVWRQSVGLGFGSDDHERGYEPRGRGFGPQQMYQSNDGYVRQGRYEVIEEPSPPPPPQRGALRIANRTSAYEGDEATDWREAVAGAGRHSRGPSRELR